MKKLSIFFLGFFILGISSFSTFAQQIQPITVAASSLSPDSTNLKSADADTPTVLVEQSFFPKEAQKSESQNFIDQAHVAMGHQQWNTANNLFSKASSTLLLENKTLTPEQSFDWARVAWWAGNLGQAETAWQQVNNQKNTIPKSSLNQFEADLAFARSHGPGWTEQYQTSKPDITPPVSNLMILTLGLTMLAFGIGVTVIILRTTDKKKYSSYGNSLYHYHHVSTSSNSNKKA